MAKKGARTDCVCRFSKLSPKCAERLRSACASSSRGQMGDLPPAFARNFSGPNAAFAPLFAPSICSLTFFGAFFRSDVLEENSPLFPRETRTFRSCKRMRCAARHARNGDQRHARDMHAQQRGARMQAALYVRNRCTVLLSLQPLQEERAGSIGARRAAGASTCAKRQAAVRCTSCPHATSAGRSVAAGYHA